MFVAELQLADARCGMFVRDCSIVVRGHPAVRFIPPVALGFEDDYSDESTPEIPDKRKETPSGR